MLYRVELFADEDALDSARRFYTSGLQAAVLYLLELSEPLTLVFPPADHTHRGWRLAAVQSLARAQAPRRINAVESDDEAAITAAASYLERAAGVTGQYLQLDGHGAGPVVV